MNVCKRTIIMAAGTAMAALAVAGPASASTATQSVRSFIFPVKATTTVRTQAIGNGGVWATVTVQRTATVSGGAPVLPFHCGPGASRCFGYSAVVKDTGSFRAYRLAGWPKLFFPLGTRFSPVLISGYQVSYGAWTRCGPQRWTDSSTSGHGNLPLDGNIRGC
jgi:hypothetical protein